MDRTTPFVFKPGRRVFLKTGVAGTALLLLGRWLSPAHAITDPLVFLTDEDVTALRRIVPVILSNALPSAPAARTVAVDEVVGKFDQAAMYLPANLRSELRDLLNVLNQRAARAVTGGIWTSWERASDARVAKFLTTWRNSRIDLLRSGYIALHNLTMGSWYGSSRAWTRIGYGGPPRLSLPRSN